MPYNNNGSFLWKTVLALAIAAAAIGEVCAQERATFDVPRAAAPPKIDGILDDEAWQQTPLVLGDWISYNPLYGEKLIFQTEVRLVYDDKNLYFAFHCFDPEPAKIRTTISRRDSIFNDDWVGFSLDSANTGQTSYHLIVNPNGIQMDALNTPSSGERWEADLLWDSAAKLTSDGYIVEIKLPLQSIRFSGGNDVNMGILFWRRISRTGVSSSWPDIPPGQGVFNRHAHLVFGELHQRRLLEVLPSVTHSITQLRAAQDRWNPWINDSSVGLNAKLGITSNVTLDTTINPDFSQVESDAFQVQVNQRYPIFYKEKRPQSDYLGTIVTDTEYTGRHNRVVGGDMSIRPSSTQQLSATFLDSETGIRSAAVARGTALQMSYTYSTRRVTSATQVEHYGRDFQMDTGFYNRTGFTSGWTYGEVDFYPREASHSIVTKIYPFYWNKSGRDEIQNGNER